MYESGVYNNLRVYTYNVYIYIHTYIHLFIYLCIYLFIYCISLYHYIIISLYIVYCILYIVYCILYIVYWSDLHISLIIAPIEFAIGSLRDWLDCDDMMTTIYGLFRIMYKIYDEYNDIPFCTIMILESPMKYQVRGWATLFVCTEWVPKVNLLQNGRLRGSTQAFFLTKWQDKPGICYRMVIYVSRKRIVSGPSARKCPLQDGRTLNEIFRIYPNSSGPKARFPRIPFFSSLRPKLLCDTAIQC